MAQRTPEVDRQEKMATLKRDAAILFFASGSIAAGLASFYGLPGQISVALGVAAGFFVTLVSIIADGDGA